MAQNKRNNTFMNTDSNRSRPIISDESEDVSVSLPDNQETKPTTEEVKDKPLSHEPPAGVKDDFEPVTNKPKPAKKQLKKLQIGETLIGTEQGKFNGHLTEFKIYYGNFIKPMVENPKTHEYEFKTLKEDVLKNILNEFLSSPEGSEYEAPSEEEIKEANRIVKEREEKYIEKLRQAKKPVEEKDTNEQKDVKSTLVAPMPLQGEQPEKGILKNILSKKKEQKHEVEEIKTEENSSPKTEAEQTKEEPTIVSEDKVNTEKLRYMDDEKSYTEQGMEKYRKMGFSNLQLEQIEMGLDNEVDVSYFAHIDFTPSQMETIRKKLQAETGVPNEARDKFNQDYFEEREKRNDEILSKEEANNSSMLKAVGTGFAILVFSLVVVALLIMVITMLIKAFKTYSAGLF